MDEGGQSLLDKSLIIYGSPMGDGNVHNHKRCPLVLLGGAQRQARGQRASPRRAGTPMANVMLSAMHMIGLDDIAQFGDSTGAFDLSAAGSSGVLRFSRFSRFAGSMFVPGSRRGAGDERRRS